MKFFIYTDKGSRDHFEDRYVVARVPGSMEPHGRHHHVYGVFDGHSGEELAEFSSQHLTSTLTEAIRDVRERNARGLHTHCSDKDIVHALKDTVQKLDTAARNEMPKSSAGTTACIVYMTPTSIITLNVGDSRAILRVGASKDSEDVKTLNLSRDHKPGDSDEMDRIMQCGGFVTVPERGDGVHRVMGRLSLSRALGDWDMRPWVSATPDVTIQPRSSRDDFVVLATDGVWDVMTSAEVANALKRYFNEGKRPYQALDGLLRECRRRGSGDNITIVLVDMTSDRRSAPL